LHARLAFVLLQLDKTRADGSIVRRGYPDHEAEERLAAWKLAEELVQLVHEHQRLDALGEHEHDCERQGEEQRHKKLVHANRISVGRPYGDGTARLPLCV